MDMGIEIWLGIVGLLVSGAILFFSWRGARWAKRGAETSEELLDLSKRDLDMHVGFLIDGSQIREKLHAAPGESFQVGITNLGGSTSPAGEVRVTAGPGVQDIVPSTGWQEAEKHPKMPAGSNGWRTDFGEVASGGVTAFPAFHIPENSDFGHGRLLWEVYIDGRGANSAYLDLHRQV